MKRRDALHWVGLSGLLVAALSSCNSTSKKDKADKKETAIPVVQPTPTEEGGYEVKVTLRKVPSYQEAVESTPNVGTVSKITDNHDPRVLVGPPVLSPTEEVLLFTELTKEGDEFFSNIYRLEIGRAAKTRVTSGRWLDLDPCFTPDGQLVVFSSNRTSSNSTLWRVRINAEGGLTKITNSPTTDLNPSVSPDGVKIAYASLPVVYAGEPDAGEKLRNNEYQIWTIEAGGSYPTQLREGEQPRISPDGKRILFVRRKSLPKGPYQLWSMSVEGGEETLLTSNTDYDVVDPNWSPDGRWIVFASNEGLTPEEPEKAKIHNFDIWLMKADGTGKTQLTTNGSHDDSPCWNHDGTYIFFRSNRGHAWNILRLKPML